MLERGTRPSNLTVVTVVFRNRNGALVDLLDRVREIAIAAGFEVRVVAVINDERAYDLGPHVQVIQGHGNVGFAKGVAIGVAQGEPDDLLLILNPDCEVLEGRLEPLLARLQAAEREVLVPLVLSRDGRPDYMAYEGWVFTPGRRVAEAVCRRFVLAGTGTRCPRFVKAPGTCIALRRDVADELNRPFDADFFLYGEDRDMSLRARRMGVRLTLVREAQIGHVGGESGVGISEMVARCKGDANVRIAQRRYGMAGRLLAVADLWLLARLRGGPTGRAAASWVARHWLRHYRPAPIDAAMLHQWHHADEVNS